MVEKGATDRQLARILLWFITIFTECVSGTKAGDAEAHYCNEKRRKIKIYKNFIIIFLLINEQIFF